TLLSKMLPLLHHGMYMVGIPYTERAVNVTKSGGTPYGASHVASAGPTPELSEDEKALAHVLGRRVPSLAVRLDPTAATGQVSWFAQARCSISNSHRARGRFRSQQPADLHVVLVPGARS